MPSQESLNENPNPWRVVVAVAKGQHASVAEAFNMQLKSHLPYYGIQVISSDPQTRHMIEGMLRSQAGSGGEITARDLRYEAARADGIIVATISRVSVPRRNEMTSFYDKKKNETTYTYSSEVLVAGRYSLALPDDGSSQTILFANSMTQRSHGSPHNLDVQHLASLAARGAARTTHVLQPIYQQFALTGHVIGHDKHHRDIRINRGQQHGVRVGRRWDLIMDATEENPLLGDINVQTIIGSAVTREVYPTYSVARCRARTRERVKLGMRASAQGY